MIQKQLFFAWIGNELPIYTQNAIKWFNELNPDFKINVIIMDGNNFENNNEICVRNTYKHIYNVLKKDDRSDEFYDFIKMVTDPNYNAKRHFMAYFTDVLRYELLSTYGGIYLDCDTFPVRSFDDKLLTLNYFQARGFSKDHQPYYDRYFWGYDKTCPDYVIAEKYFRKNFNNLDIKEYLTFTEEKKCYKNEFVKGILTPNLFSDIKLYVQHYMTGLWTKRSKQKYSTTKHLDEYFGTIYNQ